MNNETNSSVHWSFWLIAVVTLLWNVGGAVNFIMQTDMDFVVTLPETHRAIIEGRPIWATGGFALGVFGGALGCLLLLFRKSISMKVFVASMVGMIVTMIHTLHVATSKIEFSFAEIVVMVILPVIVAAFLIWYAKLAMTKGWTS